MQTIFLFVIAIFMCLAIFYSVKNGIKMLYFFLFMVMFQNIIVIVFCNHISSAQYAVFSAIKEMMLYVVFIWNFVKCGKIKAKQWDKGEMVVFLIYGSILARNLLMAPAGMKAAFLALRFMLLPVLCIYVGKNIKIDRRQLSKLLRFVVAFALILAVSGIIESYVLGDAFWTRIGYSTFAVKMKGNMEYSLYNGVSVNFYTWDFFGVPIRRLVSITADPLATAYLLYFGALIIMTGNVPIKNKDLKFNIYFLAVGILVVCSILSLSKAVLVLFAMTLLVCAYIYRWMPKIFLDLGIVLVVALSVVALKLYTSNAAVATSILNHLMGLKHGFTNLTLLGNGLGTAGAAVMMLTDSEGFVGESYVGTMLFQIGILGITVFGIFLYGQIRNLVRLYKMYESKIIILALVSILGVVLCMVFSDSSVSIMGTGIYFVFVGIAQQEKIYLKEEARMM